jgi:hypothetical protein
VEPTTIVGQNGTEIKQNTPIGVTGCPQAKKATLTRAQKLAKALKACHNKSRATRAKCERRARKRSG